MPKLCIIFSHASLYRESIYRLIDKTFDCEWHFSDEDSGVKRFDTNIFDDVSIHKHRVFKRFHWMDGINKLLSCKENKTYLMIAGFVDLSCWLFYLRAKLFYPYKKIYLWGHGWYGKETKVQSFIKKLIINSVDGIFCYGDYAKGLMVKEGIPTDKIFPIHNSLNYDEQLRLRKSIKETNIFKNHFNNNNPNVIFLGRLTEVKKLDQIIKSIAIIKSKGFNCNLTFIGDGPTMSKLESLVKKLKLKDCVWFYGSCFDEAKNAEFIYNANLCVAPGNIGLTAVHSMMFGCPVISHNDFKWQMPEFEVIKPGKTGDFFERDSIEDLAEKIQNWLNVHKDNTDAVRRACEEEIDLRWNPYFQIEVIKNNLKFADG